MSTHVYGIVPPDETWLKMKAAWDACRAANIPPPRAVEEFFNDETPDPAGVVLPLKGRRYKAEMEDGYEVDIDSLPSHVKTIRFVNSY